ncbi:hypothetical protein AAW00_00230 [Aurantiacibacter luteus]|uniref:Uncharacterized protein n=1 Tax=Aurantiacibacter luteus TaxID=1581420 RepID=A0A0G9N0A5_9SPHN|nr:hypothetical protein AAW00_00230 [Aurantiacibacter luteus]
MARSAAYRRAAGGYPAPACAPAGRRAQRSCRDPSRCAGWAAGASRSPRGQRPAHPRERRSRPTPARPAPRHRAPRPPPVVRRRLYRACPRRSASPSPRRARRQASA